MRRALFLALASVLPISAFACGDDASTGPQLDLTGVEGGARSDSSTPPAPVEASTKDAPPDAPAAVCGDGVVEAPETCDGDCPTTCDDANACTDDALQGSSADCDAVCQHTRRTVCSLDSDGCCPTGCDSTTDSDCSFLVDPTFSANYAVTEIPAPAGLPSPFGGLTIRATNTNEILIGGSANSSAGAIYRVPVVRDAQDHIVGVAGEATKYADAPNIDGGLLVAPNGALVFTRYSNNELGFIAPAGTTMAKSVPLGAPPLNVPSSVGGLAIVPPGFPGAGTWKSVSWSGGQWYELALTPDGSGLYDVTTATSRTTIVGGPEGIAYVPLGSPGFAVPSVIISEYSNGQVTTYELDANGDPDPTTRRVMIGDLVHAEGAALDPVTNDLVFSTYGGGDRIMVVRGFAK